MFKKILLGSVMAAAAATGANAVVIDDFSDSSQRLCLSVLPGGTDTGCTYAAAPHSVTLLNNAGGGAAGEELGAQTTIIGGYRDITTTLIAAGSNESYTRSNANIVGNGVFTHGQDPGVSSHSAITWDGLGGEVGLNNADFTDGGLSHSFHLVLLEADNTIRWSIELFDGAAYARLVFPNPFEVVLGDPAADLYIPFAWFTANPAGTTLTGSFSLANFASVDRMIFTANVDDLATLDTQVALIETTGVPEPASLSLLGAGIMGLGYFGKRRKG